MKKATLLVVFLSLVTGCAARLGYENLDVLLFWYIDDYVELKDSQKSAFTEQLNALQNWHKSEELPRYREMLIDFQIHLNNNDLNKDFVYSFLLQGRELAYGLRKHAAEAFAPLANTLDAEQITYLFAALEKKNSEFAEDIEEQNKLDEKKRIKEKAEELEERIEDLIGRLSKAQKKRVLLLATELKDTDAMRLSYWREAQQAARLLFIKRKTLPNFSDKLVEIIDKPENYRSQLYNDTREYNKRLVFSFLVEFAPTLTTKQIKKLNRKVSGYIEDIDDILSSD